MKKRIVPQVQMLLALSLLATSGLHTAAASEPVPTSLSAPAAIDTGVFQPVVDGLLGHYGWVTSVLLVIGWLHPVAQNQTPPGLFALRPGGQGDRREPVHPPRALIQAKSNQIKVKK